MIMAHCRCTLIAIRLAAKSLLCMRVNECVFQEEGKREEGESSSGQRQDSVSVRIAHVC